MKNLLLIVDCAEDIAVKKFFADYNISYHFGRRVNIDGKSELLFLIANIPDIDLLALQLASRPNEVHRVSVCHFNKFEDKEGVIVLSEQTPSINLLCLWEHVTTATPKPQHLPATITDGMVAKIRQWWKSIYEWICQ